MIATGTGHRTELILHRNHTNMDHRSVSFGGIFKEYSHVLRIYSPFEVISTASNESSYWKLELNGYIDVRFPIQHKIHVTEYIIKTYALIFEPVDGYADSGYTKVNTI
eukprot:359006_1